MILENTAVSRPSHVLSPLGSGSWALKGIVNDKIHYVQENQLLDPKQWAVFVNQFRTHSDLVDNGWRGEFWGKMMRGACITWQYTQNEELYGIMTDTVRDLLTASDEQGCITTYPANVKFTGWDIWCRKYVLMGLLYYLRVCRDKKLKNQILDTLIRQADFILDHIGPASEGKTPIINTSDMFGGINSSSILEPMLFLYRETGLQRYLDFAAHIIECGGAQGDNILHDAIEDKKLPYQYSSTKAYELTSFFEGVVEYYLITGDENAYTAAVNYYKAILRSDRTIVGSLAINGEMLSNAAVEQSNPDFLGHKQETCVTVTWMKFCYRILQLTGDSTVADELERSVYNAMLGSVLKKEIHYHLFDSYSPMMFQSRKNLGAGYQDLAEGGCYGCCEAIGAAGTGIIPAISTMRSENGLAVNLYIPGTVSSETPSGKKVTLKTETNYPVDGEIKLTVKLESSETFDLLLRIPAWSKQTKVQVGSEEITPTPGEYLVLSREWKDGDTVCLSLDMRTRLVEPMEGSVNPNSIHHVALMCGPLVLARDARLDTGDVIEAAVLASQDGYVKTSPSATAKFDTLVEREISLKDGSTIHVVDYLSAGTTGKPDSMLTVWIPTTDYWSSDLGAESVALRCVASSRLACFNEDGLLQKGQKTTDASVLTSCALRFEKVSKLFYTIQDLRTGLYVTVQEDCQIILEPLGPSDAQLWRLERAGANAYRIIHKSGRLLSESGEDPKRIHLFDDCRSSKQCWIFENASVQS